MRVSLTPNLAAQFRELKSLTVELIYSDREKLHKTSTITYRVNLAHAHVMFCFPCIDGECVGGDFDLSQPLKAAINARWISAKGHLDCPGRRPRLAEPNTPCPCMLHYSLALAFRAAGEQDVEAQALPNR